MIYKDSFIGVTGFEPAASWSRTKHSTGLSHTPITMILYHTGVGLSRGSVKFSVNFTDMKRGAFRSAYPRRS